jgi:hypothetical protein
MNRLPLFALALLVAACRPQPAPAPADGPAVDYGPMPRVVGDATTAARPAKATSPAEPTTARSPAATTRTGP